MRNIVAFSLLLSVVLAGSQAGGAPIILKDYDAPGYVLSSTADAKISNHSTSERQYNSGGAGTLSALYQTTRVMLVKFDTTVIPDLANVSGVNSAKLRLYRTNLLYTNGNLQVGQLAQDWVEGTGSGNWDGVCDGVQWYTRNAGTLVNKTSLVSGGTGVWYIDGVTGLANDPATAGKMHVRVAGNNFNNSVGSASVSFAHADSLAALQGLGTTRGYYYDAAANRLYLNKNDQGIRWYSTSDQWATPGAGIVGSYVYDSSYPAKPLTPPNWIEVDVTAMVQNWLVNGQGNYGFRVQQVSGENTFVTSEYTTDPTLRPELVLDLAYVPEPASLALLLGGVAVVLRRRR